MKTSQNSSTLRCFDESHKNWWENVLRDKDRIFLTPEGANTWPLDDIILIKERQPKPASSDTETSEVIDVPRPSRAQVEVEKLVSEQLDEIREV